MNAAQGSILEVLLSDPDRGFDGDELERRTGLKYVGASADWLVRHGYAEVFVGGVGLAHTYWQATGVTDRIVELAQ